MTRAEKFLELQKQLETHLRTKLGPSKTLSYYALLDESVHAGNITIRQNKDFLQSLGDLRNILSHVSYGSRPIAEPSQDALEKFEAIVNRVMQPTSVRDIASKRIKEFEETDALLEALIDMKRNDYSQIVIRRTGNWASLPQKELLNGSCRNRIALVSLSRLLLRLGMSVNTNRRLHAGLCGLSRLLTRRAQLFSTAVPHRLPDFTPFSLPITLGQLKCPLE
jgi:hypothetical protein